jgi:lysophospholipase L1-like esterase
MSLNIHRATSTPGPCHGLRAAILTIAVAAAACGGSPTQPAVTLALICPADRQVNSPEGNPTAVTFSAEPAGGRAPVTVTCNPASGALFPVGTTRVSCTATDSASQQATCQFSIAVTSPPPTPPTPRIRYTKFMAFGDSITEGVVSPAPALLVLDTASAYPTKLRQMLAARYTAQTITVANEGKAGEYATEALERLRSALAAHHPEVVLLAEGTNDLNNGQEDAIDPAASAMEDMTRAIVNSGAVALVGTIPPMREGGPKAVCPSCIEPYNARVVALTSAKGARNVDIYTLLKADMPRLIGADGLHPTAAGYDVMARAYFDALVSWFETQTAPAAEGIRR